MGLLADSAAYLNRDLHRLGDDFDDGQVGRPASRRAVEVNQVEARGALFLPAQGHGYRVVGKDGFLLKVALVEADATAGFQVYGGYDFHSEQSR